jgi:hypothetical protein
MLEEGVMLPLEVMDKPVGLAVYVPPVLPVNTGVWVPVTEVQKGPA